MIMGLKPNEIEKYKKILEGMRNQLSKSIKGSAEQVKSVDGAMAHSQHQADQGTDDFDRSINLELMSHDFDLVRQIERALEKINENTYGICDVTGKEIPKKRLDAMPYANMTVEAQEQIEKGLI
jgi:DnaK suppressor protein